MPMQDCDYVHRIQFRYLQQTAVCVGHCMLGCHYIILLVGVCERLTKAPTVDVTVLSRTAEESQLNDTMKIYYVQQSPPGYGMIKLKFYT